jgi:hypothetical protein
MHTGKEVEYYRCKNCSRATGIRVGESLKCSYCGGKLDPEQPVEFEYE